MVGGLLYDQLSSEGISVHKIEAGTQLRIDTDDGMLSGQLDRASVEDCKLLEINGQNVAILGNCATQVRDGWANLRSTGAGNVVILQECQDLKGQTLNRIYSSLVQSKPQLAN